jgi:HK97 family phage major capsid protein
MVGICQGAVTLGKKVVLGSGLTKPTDITLAHLRSMRGFVATGGLKSSSYFLHPTMDAHLRSLNSFQGVSVPDSGAVATYKPYEPDGPNGPTLDGFPVKWINVLPAYDQAAHVSQVQGIFGDITYETLGIRDDLHIDLSREVFFATDEIGIRALERFSIGQMADAAWSVVQLAAS